MKRRILLVDDNDSLVDNLSDILSEEGYTVTAAATCAAARDAARHGFTVALVDVRLPDGDGTHLAAELKEVAPESEVILLTGFATVESAAAAVRAGAWAYLVKPYDTAALLQTISQAMRHVELLEERRELERRAQNAERLAMVGTMTAGLSHEIRNPLNAAALQLTVLERRIKQLRADNEAALVEPLNLARDEIQRLNRILDDFLQFARPRVLAHEPVVLLELIERVVKLLAAQAELNGVSLHHEADATLRVTGDPERLQQALVNLVLNAIQATPAGGEVMVRATPGERGWVLLHVDDSGPGVPPEQRDRIFEPFFTTKQMGSGLGLSIVHAVTVQHGGHMRVDTSPAGGARFTMQLPWA